MSSPSFLRATTFLSVLVTFGGSLACGDSKPPSTNVEVPDGGTPDGGASPSGGLAVLVSDFASAAVSLLDKSTLAVVRERCLSASSFSASQVALSGDAALASSVSPEHELVVLDRKNSVLSFLSTSDCKVRAQLSVGTGGFKANPHDVLFLSAKKAYVTRYETNHAPDPAQNGLDGGDDILVIDPSVPAVTGRIPLASHATAGAQGPTQARPGRLLAAGGHVLVALDSLNADFSDQGPGRVLAIDPATDQVTGQLDIPSFKNCGALASDPASKRVVVSCGGSFAAASQIDESGLAIFDLGSEPAAMTLIKASVLGDQPLSFAALSLVDANTAFVAGLGSLDFTTQAVLSRDTLLRVDLANATATKLLTSSPYGLGAHLVVNDVLVLADGDATAPRLRVLPTGGTAAEKTAVDADPSHHLPPRDLVLY